MARRAVTARKAAGVYALLKQHLMAGGFRSGEHLPAQELALRLGVSVTPLREALNRLHGENWVLASPQEGFFARRLSVTEMVDRYGLAQLVLDHAALTADGAPAADPVGGTAGPDGQGAGAVRSLARRIEALYGRIAAGSGNQAMMDLVRDFNERTHLVRLIDLEAGPSYRRNAAAAAALAGALGRDRAAVQAQLHALLESQRIHMVGLVKEALARGYLSPPAALG